jgi:hypothetical protein
VALAEALQEASEAFSVASFPVSAAALKVALAVELEEVSQVALEACSAESFPFHQAVLDLVSAAVPTVVLAEALISEAFLAVTAELLEELQVVLPEVSLVALQEELAEMLAELTEPASKASRTSSAA